MKIFSPSAPFLTSFNDNKATSASLRDFKPVDCGWIGWPDSCVLGSNRPIFIPDFDKSFKGYLALAGRIGGVGKTIAGRFAHRYINAFTAAIIIISSKAEKSLNEGMTPCHADLFFDNAIVLGDMLPINTLSNPFDSEFEFEMKSFQFISGGKGVEESDETAGFTVKLSDLFPTIVDSSRRTTLKSGDIILSPLHSSEFVLEENANIRISIPSVSDEPVLIAKFR